ncbi:hypothetical protein COK05_27550, partial [Bacillus cereus]
MNFLYEEEYMKDTSKKQIIKVFLLSILGIGIILGM